MFIVCFWRSLAKVKLILSYFSDNGTLPVDWPSLGTLFYILFRNQSLINRMPFSPHGVEKPNHLHCMKERTVNLCIIHGEERKRKLFSNFVFFLNALDLWFQAVLRENPKFA